MPTITITRPHEAQKRIITTSKRYNVVNCGRRFGKTTLGIDRLVTPESLAHPMAWFAPTYKDMLEVWRQVVETLQPITTRRNVQERRIEMATGGTLEFWSLDNQDAGRGRKYKRIVIDEAAIVPNLLDAWNYTIRPTLADLEGDAWIFSTPKGRNGFWQMYHFGQDAQRPDWQSWTMPTSANPYIADSEIEAMRQTMPEMVYRQEILAEFIDDAGGIFRMVTEAATAESQAQAIDGHQYIFGIDWAYSVDFTVVAVVDVTARSLVHYDRFNGVDYTTQRGRIAGLAKRFKPISIIAESNAMGQPNNEELRKSIGHLVTVTDFHTSNTTKASIIQSLAGAFERGDIKIINDAVLIGELQAYEGKRLEGGRVKYSAPSGMHDDTVIALALAWSGVSDGWLAW